MQQHDLDELLLLAPEVTRDDGGEDGYPFPDAMARLTQSELLAVDLCVLDGLPYVEAAPHMGVTPQWCGQLVRGGLKKLREAIPCPA